ncbi:MAG: hypothetical protein GX080_04855 [Tissierellia bacterium]|nr:hypothetical protein [Tissierellia bacterium]
MSKQAENSLSIKKDKGTFMGAKVANQINTNQQSNMCLTQLSVVTQNSSTVNISLA